MGERVHEVLGAFLGGRLELGAGDIVQLDDIHVRERVLAEVAEGGHLVTRVVDASDEGILVGRAPAGAVDVLPHYGVEVEQGVLLHTGHEEVAGLLHSGVK